MAEIELRNVTKYYDDPDSASFVGDKRPALGRVSLTIREGETLSVVGPSGCGKSTLLKVVAGLEFPDRGQVLYDGHDFTDIRPRDRGVGMVFQDYALYPTKKGEGNLKYFFEVHERSEGEMLQKVKETAELMGVGFELLLGRIPDTLSGGEKQRVAIARCIVRDPSLFLMDEPICNLDAKLRERTRVEIKKLLRKFAVTTVYITHDQQEAVFMGDRIAVMRQGALEQLGTYDDLYYGPVNAFVATFIGAPAMSLLPATVERGSLRVGEARWALPLELAGVLPEGSVQLGVRPEGWRLEAEGGAPLEVRHVERLPTEGSSFVSGTLLGQRVTVLAPLDTPEQASLPLLPDWEQAYFFSPDDGRAVHTPQPLELF